MTENFSEKIVKSCKRNVSFFFFFRQSSLPSAESDLSMPCDLEWGAADSIMVDGERVYLRKKYRNNSNEDIDPFGDNFDEKQDNSPILQAHSPGVHKPQEPNIDFELDVKVFINSGKCVLHTKDTSDEMRMYASLKIA